MRGDHNRKVPGLSREGWLYLAAVLDLYARLVVGWAMGQLSYQHRLAEYGLIPNMSRKGNCWDNACVESFFGTLKRELVHQRQYATRDEATRDIFEYIETLPIVEHLHSTLGYHAPVEFEARAAIT